MKHDLNALAAFSRVAYHRSFRRAANELRVTPSALSHSLSKLEENLGVRLLNRSTRSVHVTDAGQRLLLSLNSAFSGIDQAIDILNEARETPMGRLRLNVPRAGAQLVIAPKLSAWKTAFPDVELDIVTNDGLVDIVEQGFDAGMRFGESLQQDMIAIPIGPVLKFTACASPEYLSEHGVPKTPRDLLTHHCLLYRFSSGAHYAWEFQSGRKQLEVSTKGKIASDDFMCLIQAALDGAGICYTYEAYVKNHLQQGQLRAVLQDWTPPGERMFLYFPSRANLPLSLRAFIDFFK